MPITKQRGRQGVIEAFVEFNFADIPTVATWPAIDLPPGAIIVGGDLVVTTAWNNSGTATLAIGDATTGNRYLTATSLKSAGRTALVPTGFRTTTAQPSVTAVTALSSLDSTAGVARLRVAYIVDKRVSFTQG
jgi:hypothetical protein